MVEDIINYVSSNWVAWVFAAGYAVLIAMLKKERTQNKALREGVQALLRQEIIDFCLRYEDRGSAPVWAKQAEEKAYKAYEAWVMIVAVVSTVVAAAALAQYFGIAMLWYYWLAAVVVGLLVCYAAMFGYDNLYKQINETLQKIRELLAGTTKEE